MTIKNRIKKLIVVVGVILYVLFSPSLQASQKLVLILDWFVNPNHAPIFVAQDQGFFKKYGLEVEILTPADPSDPPKWIAMGKGDVALDYQPRAILEIAKGLPLKQIGTLIDQPLNCLVVLADSPITKLADLRGKQIAYSAPEIDLLILKRMLQYENLSLREVRLINVHYDLLQALLSKKVSAAIGMMRNFELIQLQLLKQPGRAFFPENYGVPAYSELVFIVNAKHFQDERFDRFFMALEEAKNFLLKNPQESWQRFAVLHKELNNELNKKVWFATLNKFAKNFHAIDAAQYDRVTAFLSKDLSNRLVK